MSPMMVTQNQTPQHTAQNQIYINPNAFLGMRQALAINNNEQEKDEKSSENLSEETLSTRAGTKKAAATT